jgi:hypothetical protein
MWASLTEAAEVFGRMAEGSLERAVYVSSLDVGVGKTSLLKQCVRALATSPEHSRVAALVCMKRLDQIDTVAREMGLGNSDYAVLTSDHDKLNTLGLGAGAAGRARVLFTTQRMVEVRSEGKRFSDVAGFQHRGRVRQVLVWDELTTPRPFAISGTCPAAPSRSVVSRARPYWWTTARSCPRTLVPYWSSMRRAA